MSNAHQHSSKRGDINSLTSPSDAVDLNMTAFILTQRVKAKNSHNKSLRETRQEKDILSLSIISFSGPISFC